MPAPIVVPAGNKALFRLTAIDAGGIGRAATGTLTISDFVNAYVVKVPDSVNQYCVKSMTAPTVPGSAFNFTVTVNALDAQGGVIPPFVMDFTIPGPPLPPLAVQVVITEGPFIVDFPAPPNPGTFTIDL